MARVLIVYGTRTGHTARLVDDVADVIRRAGHTVDRYDALDAPRGLAVAGYDGVVVAASLYAQRYQREVRRWVSRHQADLRARPNAFLSVCLTSALPDPDSRAAVQRLVDRFAADTGWHPDVVHAAAGMLPYSRYNPVVRRLMRWQVRDVDGGRYTDTSRDWDLTDYDALAAFARAFAGRVDGRVVTAVG